MHDYVTGIQQVGVGVTDAQTGKLLYKEMFGLEALIFDDVAEAKLMTQYTGGEVHSRRAALTMNMNGGGGFEIWQYKSRTPAPPTNAPQYGDYGINAPKIKCRDIKKAHEHFTNTGKEVSTIKPDPVGAQHFFVKDDYGNLFNIILGTHWFQDTGNNIGGVSGAVIGVEDMDKAITLYRDVLGLSETTYDVTNTFTDNPEGSHKCRRVLLKKPQSGKGGFGKLLGSVEIELIQVLDRQPVKIFDNRYWGDLGFVHLCFDIINMDGLKKVAEEKGFTFSVDSENSFDMESAAGRFCYIESPEGTLIELVETHKVPVMKKLGLYINLKKRNLEKPLPDWMVKLLALSKVK